MSNTANRSRANNGHAGAALLFFSAHEYLVLLYIGLCVIWFSLSCIMPFLSFSLKTPLSGMSGWLRQAGAVLAILSSIRSLFGRGLQKMSSGGGMRRAPGVFLLYIVCLIAVLSSWVQREYGYKSNLETIMWMVIVVTLFYRHVCLARKAWLKKCLGFFYGTELLLWTGACSLSLVQFVLQIGTYGPNHSSSPWLGGVGFDIKMHRLFGLFGYPEYGALTGLMLVIAGIYYCFKARSRLKRALILMLQVPILLYIVISQSRNTAVALFEVIFFGVFLYLWKYAEKTWTRNPVVLLCLSFIAVAVSGLLYAGILKAAGYMPGIFAGKGETGVTWSQEILSIPFPQESTSQSAYAPDEQGVSSEPAHVPVYMKKGEEMLRGRFLMSLTQSKDGFPVAASKGNGNSEDKILKREYKKGDITTGRLRIWKEYLSLYKEIGLIGLSPENAGFYIQKTHPELFICRYIKRTNKALYDSGYVLHTHSGYLRTFVAAGFLGIGCLLVFIVLTIKHVIRAIIRSKRLNPEFLFPLLIVLTGASSALFDNEVFFNMNPSSLIFWIALGIVMRNSRTAIKPSED